MKKTAILAVIILFCSVIAHGCIGKPVQSAKEGTEPLLVYCGAGMRAPMDELGSQFEQEYGVNVICNYAGSGHLLNQIELAQNGDVYQPGAMYYFTIARDKGFVDYGKSVAYHVPVIVVPKGNPANVTCLNDLANPGVKVALGDPEACAIGKVGAKILEKNGIKDAVGDNVIARGATVNALIVYVSKGDVDAAITWDETVLFAPDATDSIEIPEEENIIKIIPVGTLTFSENKESARKFVDFITSDCSKAIYDKYGFTPYRQGDIGGINETNR
ncbi:MAG: molybdate ABC transporter substrate-binding protein [Candidatus Methanogaster sp.]|uniref:Molybdate ABC transporter substrate-binding protein n=1 Tax=Candidatus Methanogaster sp. TaxID=3386292 RepID=A0AC61L6J6_9EURY|nr:MAG: molybdate ABC transporter substrate-binding protein [ANME-2 cluster archaeon]